MLKWAAKVRQFFLEMNTHKNEDVYNNRSACEPDLLCRFEARYDELLLEGNLLQSREKKQAAFEKAKKDLAAVSKNVDTVKLKLFEILQSGSDDTAFSSWAKGQINENDNHDNGNPVNPDSVKTEKPITQNHQPHTGQNHQPQQQNQNQRR